MKIPERLIFYKDMERCKQCVSKENAACIVNVAPMNHKELEVVASSRIACKACSTKGEACELPKIKKLVEGILSEEVKGREENDKVDKLVPKPKAVNPAAQYEASGMTSLLVNFGQAVVEELEKIVEQQELAAEKVEGIEMLLERLAIRVEQVKPLRCRNEKE